MIGKGQELLQTTRRYAAHVWSENPTQPNQYMLANVSVSPTVQDWVTPFNFFTVTTCNKFSLRWLYTAAEPNSTEYGSTHPVKWQFFRTNGTLYGEYLEPEVNMIGEWEPNYGNSSTYTNGITPDFQITEPGTYYLYCMDYENDVWIPNEPTNNNSIIIQVIPSEDNNNYAINAPDSICFQDFLCWSIIPYVDPSRILSSNWTYLANPCEQANPVGQNTITVSFRKLCSNDTVTISKIVNVTNFVDFQLPAGVCPNQVFNVGNITLCNPATPIVSCIWNWGDGTSSNTQYTSHSYSTPGTYTIQLTLNVNYYGTVHTSSISKTIQVNSLPSAPIVSGNFNTCTNPGTFTITNPDTNTTYSWIANYTSGMSGTNTSQNITWNNNTFPNAPSFGNIKVIASRHGCVDSTSFKVWKCCTDGISPVYSDVTVSDFPAGTVFINGTVTINSSFSEEETFFRMGPEAKIVINAPNTFTTLYKTNFNAGCGYMWDGIYVNGTTSKVVMDHIIPVSGAMNAINSTNGGNFEIKNSQFKDNYIAIKITDYTPNPFNQINHPGVVYGSTFKHINGLIAPYAGQKAHTGIYTDNVYELTIGNNNQAANTFDNLLCGIQSYNSYITLNKNNFANIKKVGRCAILDPTDFTSLYCETAIHVAKIQRGTLAYTPLVRLTGNETNQNTFTNCDQAYYSYKAWQTISYNTVNSTNTAFFCRDLMNGSTFNNNKINGSKQGIYILNSIPTVKNITIQSNSISNVVSGGFGMNLLNCQSANTNRVNILNNAIDLIPNRACTGIMVAACDSISIINNNPIGCNAVNSSSYNKTNLGIKISNCPNSLVKGNTLSKLGTSIWAEGLLTGTQFQCNTLTQNYYGFYMPNSGTVATAYSNQGTSAIPNDNKWTDHPSPTSGIPTYRITGDANSNIISKNWYYRAGITSYFPNVVSPNPATNFVAMSQLSSNALSPCGSKGGDDDNFANTDTTSTMEASIPENANLAIQMRYLYMSMLYNTNSEFFANEIAETAQGLYDNIPLIAKINELAQNDSTLDKAIALNNTLAPVNEMETYRKFANDIYLNYVAKGAQPSAELIGELYTIADMAPNIGGEAVYIARAILNYNPEFVHRNNIIMPLDIKVQDNVQFYPNPANDVLNISTVENFVSGSKIELYDITGRMVYSTAIVTESNSTSISLKEVNQGLYLCVIKSNKEIISSFKISVVKQ